MCCNVVEAMLVHGEKNVSSPEMQGDAKQLLVCLEAWGSACVCQVTNQPLEVFVIIFLYTVWMEGFGTQRLRMSAEL